MTDLALYEVSIFFLFKSKSFLELMPIHFIRCTHHISKELFRSKEPKVYQMLKRGKHIEPSYPSYRKQLLDCSCISYYKSKYSGLGDIS